MWHTLSIPALCTAGKEGEKEEKKISSIYSTSVLPPPPFFQLQKHFLVGYYAFIVQKDAEGAF